MLKIAWQAIASAGVCQGSGEMQKNKNEKMKNIDMIFIIKLIFLY